MNICWKASFSASCLHAAACLREGLPVADAQVAAWLGDAAEELVAEIDSCGLDVDAALPLLVSLASEFESNRQLAAAVLRRLQGYVNEGASERLAGRIADLEAALLREQPGLVDELAVRGRPLQEQWEARGPGLLHVAGRLTDENWIVPAAEVVLVLPAVGGHGRAHVRQNRVSFEAVLAHPHADLPETLRLGWLLAQMQGDLPMFGDTIPGPRQPLIAQLATLPVVLAAADEVELGSLSAESLSRAIECWHLPTDLPANLPELLLGWWQTYINGSTRWPVALAALDAMLAT